MQPESSDRFHLGSYSESQEVWELLLTSLTPYEATLLRAAMEEQERHGDEENDDLESALVARAAEARGRRGGGEAPNVKEEPKGTSSSGSPSHPTRSALPKSGCSPPQFCRAYLTVINSIAFQKYRKELIHRLQGLFGHYDTTRSGRLRFVEFPPLKAHLEGIDPSTHKPRITTYTEQGVIINDVVFSKDVTDRLRDLPSEFKGASISACRYLKYHAGIAKYSASCGHVFFLFDINRASESIEVTHVLYGPHKSIVTSSIHIPQLRRLVTAGPDRQIVTWDDQLFTPCGKARVSSPVSAIDYEPYTQNIVAGCTDGCLFLLPAHPHLQPPTHQVKAHTGWVTDVRCVSELQQVVTAGADGIIKMWTHNLEVRSTKIQDHVDNSKGARNASTFEALHGGGPQLGISLNSLCYSTSMRTLFSSISGRNLCLWNPFIDLPTESLEFHDKPILFIHCFRNSPELLTVDAGGRVGVWDISSNLVTQRFGGPDSVTPAGSINSAAYCPESGSLVTMGSWMTVFSPEQGAFAPLFELPISHIVFAPVNKVVIAATGNKVIVVDVITGASTNVFSIGVEEVTSLTLTSREHLLIGTSNANVYFTTLVHWRLQKVTTLDDAAFLLHDVGEGSRLGARGEDNGRVLCVSQGGRIGHCAYGPLAGLTPAPAVFYRTVFQSVTDAAFLAGTFSVFMAEDNVIGCWDVENGNRRGNYSFRGLVIALRCVASLDALFVSLTDGTLWLFHATSTIPVATVSLNHDIGPTLGKAAPALKAVTKTAANSLLHGAAIAEGREMDVSGPILSSIAYNASNATLIISTAFVVQALDVERLLQLVHRETAVGDKVFHAAKCVQLVSSAARRAWDDDTLVHKENTKKATNVRSLVALLKARSEAQHKFREEHNLWVDTVTYRNDIKPYCFRCKFKCVDRVMFVAEADGQGTIRCIRRLLQLRTWMARNAGTYREDTRQPSVTDSYYCKPEMIHVPTTAGDAVLPGLEGKSVYAIFPPIKADAASVLDLERMASVHHSELAPEAHSAIRWLLLCIASALEAAHSDGKVTLFSQNSIRFVSPNFQLFLEHGLWEATTAEETVRSDTAPNSHPHSSEASRAEFEALLEASEAETSVSETVSALFQGNPPPRRNLSVTSAAETVDSLPQQSRKSRATFLLNENGWEDTEMNAHETAFLAQFRLEEATFEEDVERRRRMSLPSALPSSLVAAEPWARPTPAQSLSDALSHLPTSDLPPGGMQCITPAVDMWLLGLVLFRASSGKAFEARGLEKAGKGRLGERVANTADDVATLISDQIQSSLHPALVQDTFLTEALEGLLTPNSKKRLTAQQLLQLAAKHRVGKCVEVTSLEDVDLARRGVTFPARPQVQKRAPRYGRKALKEEAPVAQVQLASHHPMTVIHTNPLDGALELMESGSGSLRSEDRFQVLQFLPPPHLRLPRVDHPFVRNDHVVLSVPSTLLTVLKDPFNPADHAPRTEEAEPMLMTTNSFFCTPANPTLGGGPISFTPLMPGGRFSCVLPLPDQKIVLTAEFNKKQSYSFISFRRNLAPETFTHTLLEYVAEQKRLNPKTVGRRSSIQVLNGGPSLTSAYSTQVLGVLPPNNAISVLGGVELLLAESGSTLKQMSNRLPEGTVDVDGLEDSNVEDFFAKLNAKQSGVDMDPVPQGVFGALPRVKKSVYDPSQFCPFFTDSRAMAEQEGIETTGPDTRPFYMNGWHTATRKEKEDKRRKAHMASTLGKGVSGTAPVHLPPLSDIGSTPSARSFVSKLRENNRLVDHGMKRRELGFRRLPLTRRDDDDDMLCLSTQKKKGVTRR